MSEGCSYLDAAKKALVQDKMEHAKKTGDSTTVALLSEILPEMVQCLPKDPTPYQEWSAASKKYMAAQQKAERALDQCAKARVAAQQAQLRAEQAFAQAQQAEADLAAAREKYSQQAGLDAASRTESGSVRDAVSSDRDVQEAVKGVEQDSEIANLLQNFEAQRTALLELAAKKRAEPPLKKAKAGETDGEGESVSGDIPMDGSVPPGPNDTSEAQGSVAGVQGNTDPGEGIQSASVASYDEKILAERANVMVEIKATTQKLDVRKARG